MLNKGLQSHRQIDIKIDFHYPTLRQQLLPEISGGGGKQPQISFFNVHKICRILTLLQHVTVGLKAEQVIHRYIYYLNICHSFERIFSNLLSRIRDHG
jgi:hypothetical protein